MKTQLKQIMLALTLVFTFASCSSDDDKGGNNSRDVKYEITGNFSGQIDAVYMESGDAGQSVDITKLPWTKEFTASAGTTGAGIQASGHGGVVDQTLTIKIYVGGKVEKETTAKAKADGTIIAIPGTYIFPL
ncbi:MmpS family protein [Flavobacterium johnsoniae]|uniref:MmpS family transport accessory protein n=1 Tax=Flavobacterium johnsoniae TaxID=986 RepID=UPI0025AF6136|nr:MmpS family transport accessory protein [Flavobacterium johnsoniae]WJS95371.1 MmpS family protein [Flavobacterium johnsoniae]